MNLNLLPGKPFPLGATVFKKGVNFALYSENALGVELCLFNADNSPAESFILTERRFYLACLRGGP